MAGRIQGITVEIGGDTTKLQTALKGVNTEIRNTQSQLRDVDKLLKLDPGNTELLAQKHRLLGAAVKETKEKLETLKTAAVKTAADFDSAMSKVAAVSGVTGSDLEALRDKAREMGEKTKFSASEAAEAMNYMVMAGWKTEDMLSGIEGVMNLSAASGENLATISDIVTDALTAFGLTAKDSGHFADILAAASSNANTNVSMMGETFKYCAPIAGALGFSAEDTAEAIGLMANAGIKLVMSCLILSKLPKPGLLRLQRLRSTSSTIPIPEVRMRNIGKPDTARSSLRLTGKRSRFIRQPSRPFSFSEHLTNT